MLRWHHCRSRLIRFGVPTIAAAGCITLGAPVALAGSSSPPPLIRPPAHGPTLHACDGGTLNRSAITAGECVNVTAKGFAANEIVLIRLLTTADRTTTASADRDGVLHYGFTVPANTPAGADVLTMVGQAAFANVAGVPAGNLTVTVPRAAVAWFTVRACPAPDPKPGHGNNDQDREKQDHGKNNGNDGKSDGRVKNSGGNVKDRG